MIENSNGTPSTNTTKWELLIKNASEKDRGVIQLATQQEVYDGINDLNAITPLNLQKKLNPILNRKTPIYGEYEPSRQYESGDLIKVNGIWYECYHPDGCKGIDPTDPANRPSGWTNTDIHAPYYWIAIGKYLMLPEIGSPFDLATTVLREGLIKYSGDDQISASKFWRIAELNPNLVDNGFIGKPDLRAMTTRGLDDGRGIDIDRVINSFQSDASRKITGSLTNMMFYGGKGPGNNYGSGVFNAPSNIQPLTVGSAGNGGAFSHVTFDSSTVVPTHIENVVKNVAMLKVCRF